MSANPSSHPDFIARLRGRGVNGVRWLPALLLLAVLVGCQGGTPGGFGFPQITLPPVPTAMGVGPRATFVLATSAGLLGAAADGTILGRIVDLPAGSAPVGVAVHPDGKQLYFALPQTPAEAAQGIFGSDIYSVNVDGTDLRTVVKRSEPNVFYASPTLDDQGNLYVHRREGDLSGANVMAFAEVKDSIERVDTATGRRERILSDAADPTVFPDGSRIIYMRMDRGQSTDLWIASTDGTKAEKFLKTDDWFSYLQTPRISPNGRQVIWSSVPPTQPKKTSVAPPKPQPARGRSGGKLAHLGTPSDLYVAPIDGSSIRAIFTTSDDVVPSWSPDGARVAFILRATFYVLSASDGAVMTKTPNVAVIYGDPVWLKSN
jgi:Tol biopolymer transport system component